MSILYNEFDPFAAAWLRELITDRLIPNGYVDERSIVDLEPEDLEGFTQVHLFAGIGGWAYALKLAEWPEDKPVWTGSCPCQPFSAAGQRKGSADHRHLWPEMRRLIRKCDPPTVFGEQVASKDGRNWLSGVRTDLEELGYAVGAADLCAAGEGAPHIRQRLYWVADRDSARRSHDERRARSPRKNWWKESVAHPFNDGKYRRLPESSFRPVVNGLSACVGAVRGAGNAICPQVAKTFIEAYASI